MSELLKHLQRASATLTTALRPEATGRLLLEELRHLCRADLAMLLQPVAPRHWRAVLVLPEEGFSLPTAPLEILWEPAQQGAGSITPIEQILKRHKELCCHDPIRAGEFDFSHLRRLEVEQGQGVVTSLLLPVVALNGHVEQIIELLRFESGLVAQDFSADEQAAASILTRQVAATQVRMHCCQEYSDLFESLIQLIGSAIDEKSPFSGDHCRRVPVLAMMLARAVSSCQTPVFKTEHFTDADFYELEVSAWLHDIGKLIMPINITDKGTKLERTFDRFDLVRTRFEILRRDLEILRLRVGESVAEVEIPEGGGDAKQMYADQIFLSECNRGRGTLSEAEIERLNEIAEHYHWINCKGEVMPVLTADEVANLKVANGTITEAERDMIHQHAVSTINMLDMLPFPDALSRVPEIAGAHHEYYNGQGFPSGLNGRQMSMSARILAFADLFESLSAGGRPYKKRNSLSQVLSILRTMVDEGRVDPDLYRLFVEEKLYEVYAMEFLSREQIDPVDRSALLRGL